MAAATAGFRAAPRRSDPGGAGRRGYVRVMSSARQAFGELGERVAERWLRARGWRILARRFRSGHRDLDLVAERDGTVAFVEVKARGAMDDALSANLVCYLSEFRYIHIYL